MTTWQQIVAKLFRDNSQVLTPKADGAKIEALLEACYQQGVKDAATVATLEAGPTTAGKILQLIMPGKPNRNAN